MVFRWFSDVRSRLPGFWSILKALRGAAGASTLSQEALIDGQNFVAQVRGQGELQAVRRETQSEYHEDLMGYKYIL